MNTTYEQEKERLLSVLSFFCVSKQRIDAMMPIIDNTAWMSVKLEETRNTIKGSQVAIAYDNGGGQTGIRENPLYKAYNALWKSYMSGITLILNAIPDEKTKQETIKAEENRTVLEIVRNRRKKEA